jgi:hypothetical protein
MPDPNEEARLRLLLAEYEHLSDSLKENETMGERRLQFLFTLVTAAFGGIAALLQLGPRPAPPAAVVLLAAFVLLFLFGLVTLERIVKRNLATDGYIDALNAIRGYFITSGGSDTYRRAFAFYGEGRKTRQHSGLFSLRPGGLAQGTAVINAVVAGAAFGLSAGLAHLSPGCVFGGAAMVGFAAWLMQWALVRRRYADAGTR